MRLRFHPRRAFPAVVAVLLTLSAWLQASALNSLVLSALFSALGLPEPPSADQSIALPPKAPPLPARAPSTPGPRPVVASKVTDCPDVRALIVTESEDRTWSAATLLTSGESRPLMRRVGDAAGPGKVLAIGTHARSLAPTVWLSNGADLCQVELFAAPTALSSGPPARQAQAGDYSLRSLLGRVRVVPDVAQGKVLGLRLLGVGSGSLLSHLGFEDGDRLEAINGHRLTDAGTALQAYLRLRYADHFSVHINRRGRPLALEYHLN